MESTTCGEVNVHQGKGWVYSKLGRALYRAEGSAKGVVSPPPPQNNRLKIIATYIGLRVQKYQNIRVARKSIASYLRRVLPLCFSCALLFVAWPCYNVLELNKQIQPARRGRVFSTPPPFRGTIVRSTAPRARLLLLDFEHSSLSLPNHEMSHDIHRWYCPG